MQPFTILALVGTAFAATTPLSSLVPRQVLSSMSVKDAQALCGNDQTISCCNSVKQGDNVSQSSGVLSGVLNGLLADGVDVNAQCSKIDVAVLIGVQDLLNDQCTSNVACCQNSESEASNGLVNAALPCVPIGTLVG
ncbi:fungal hydrophobin domain-containing protein [Sarocladium implicatum]|nr:fungal hydrophobin domain-containing protein [Sarocladium implicatum]